MEVLPIVDAALPDGRLEALADDVELALERFLIEGRVVAGAARGGGRRAHEDVEHLRLDGARRPADVPVVRRHLAPAEELQPLLPHDHREEHLREGAGLRVGRAEEEPHRVLAGRRQEHAGALQLRAHERVGDLDHHACAVARVGLGARRRAVRELLERGQAVRDDGVRALAAEVGDEADAAGVMFVSGRGEWRAGRRAGRGRRRMLRHRKRRA